MLPFVPIHYTFTDDVEYLTITVSSQSLNNEILDDDGNKNILYIVCIIFSHLLYLLLAV